jgi:hypothetical protein
MVGLARLGTVRRTPVPPTAIAAARRAFRER